MTRNSLSSHHRIAWITASIVVGGILAAIGHERGLFQDPQTRAFELSVFLIAWLVIVFLVGVLVRGSDDLSLDSFLSRKRGGKR